MARSMTAFQKDIARTIKGSLGRFLAIAGISALGCGFFAGLLMTSPDMKHYADDYFDGNALFDVRVVSTLGLTDADLQAIQEVQGTQALMGAYEADAMASVVGEQYVTRVHSLPASALESDSSDGVHALSDDDNYLNRMVLIEGQWPEKTGECVISADLPLSENISVGDTIELTESTGDLEDSMAVTLYTVVGKVNASYYMTSQSLGTTSLGTGSIQQFMYVLEDNFAQDYPYTEAFLTVEGAAEELSLSDEYLDTVGLVIDRIDDIADARAALRTEEVKKDAQEELDDARAEYEKERADVEAELADALAELEDAEAQIEDAEKEIADGWVEYYDGVDDYESAASQAEKQIEDAEAQIEEAETQLAQGKAQLASGADELSDAWAQWQEGADSLAAAWDEFESQSAELESGISQLEAGIAQADEGISSLQNAIEAISQLEAGIESLKSAIPELESTIASLENGIQQIENAIAEKDALLEKAQDSEKEALEAEKAQLQAQLETCKSQLGALQDQLVSAQSNLATYESQLKALQNQSPSLEEQLSSAKATRDALQAQLDALAPKRAEIEAAQGELDTQQAALDAAKAQLDAQQAVYDASLQDIEDGEASLNAARAELASQKASAQAQLDDAKAQLDDAKAQLVEAEDELSQAKTEYQDGLDEYEKANQEAQDSFAEAEEELADAQSEIDDIEDAEWLVMDRSTNYGAAYFNSDAERIYNIARVFPLIFFLVAALVALTTMTRMVEEGRGLIGTYKALGYRRGAVAAKYLIYAGVAGSTGALLGILFLSELLPVTIMNAYAIIYYLPAPAFPIVLDAPIAVLSFALGVGITLLATGAAAISTLREGPAQLMQPRAPKVGRRILLERIGPLWRHTSFLWKVTFRNLFRYKKRLFMTVVGIAGCTALLLTGLGLSDSINDVVDKQYGEITVYNTTVSLDENYLSGEERATIEAAFDSEGLSERLAVSNFKMLGRAYANQEAGNSADDISMTLLIPESTQNFAEFVNLRKRESKERVTLGDDDCIIAEKIATVLGVEVGDTIVLVEQDDIGNPTSVVHEVTVSAIVENYIYYLMYLGPEAYRQAFGEEATYNKVVAIAADDAELRQTMSDNLRAVDGIETVSFNDEQIENYRSMLASVDSIVVVLVVAAMALAFIVLYNLTNINITERVREIATLKVLGFTPCEMYAYIFRETFLLSVMGTLVGLLLGIALEAYVIVTVETDQVMFGRVIHPDSYVIAFVLTIIFTGIILFLMRRKISNVNMVESLKSNE